jgi:hypothetical protein
MNLLRKKAFSGWKKENMPSSPFEDVTGVELIEYVEKGFPFCAKK